MAMKRKKKRGAKAGSVRMSAFERQVSLTFEYREMLDSIMRDLANIDQMIPAESSRHGCLIPDKEAAAIIEARKSSLLRYIQIICRDHLRWGRKLLDKGFRAK